MLFVSTVLLALIGPLNLQEQTGRLTIMKKNENELRIRYSVPFELETTGK